MATSRTRMRLRTLGWVVLTTCAIAPVFNLLTSEASLEEAVQGPWADW